MSDETNVVYKIRLEPVDKFFFGGEKSLAKDESTFYFQTSRNFPQQTSVVGMLRKTLLEEAGLLIREESGRRVKHALTPEQEAVAGTNSFSVDSKRDFGQLLSISPTFILDADDNSYYAKNKCKSKEPNDSAWTFADPNLQEIPVVKVSLQDNSLTTSFQHVENFNPKYGFESGFQAADQSTFLTATDVFADPVPQIGITKSNKHQMTDEEGFFKQTYQRLKHGFAFGCYGVFKTAVFKDSAERWVYLGGERSMFKMTLTRVLQLPDFLKTSLPKTNARLLCLSDVYLPQQVVTSARGYFSPITFKHFITSVKTDNYSKKPKQSSKYNLVEKGSVLIFDQTPEQAVLQDPAFHQIGYNHFINL